MARVAQLSARGLLVVVPIAPTLEYFHPLPPLWTFVLAALSIAILAEWVRRATEQLANHAGPSIGGLLNITFGSIAELAIAVFLLLQGEVGTVRAQITGSILGTSLLGLGLASLVGGAFRFRQTFGKEKAGLMSSLFLLAMIALLLPAAFDYAGQNAGREHLLISEEKLSLGASVVMLVLYFCNLFYTLVTHRDIFASARAGGEAAWSKILALSVLVVGTGLIAVEAELISSALTSTAEQLALSKYFLGIVVLALIGTSADLFAAVYFSKQDQMGLVMSICIGSAIQMALVVAPLLVIVSWAVGHPMSLVFSEPLELFGLGSAALVVRAIAGDGETTWFEGLMLVGVYVLFAAAFYFLGGR